MTFFLPERTPEAQAQADAIFSGKVPSFSEIARAQAEFDRIDRDLRNRALRDEGDFLRSIQERLGDEFAPGEAPDPRVTPIERSNDHIFDAVKRAQEARPEEFSDLPVDFDQFQAMNLERRASEFGELEHVLSSAPPGSMAALASITGSLQAAVTDPETLAMMLFGGNPASGILRFAAAEGGLAALDEARTLPDQFARQRELGGPEPAPVSQVATAFGVGAALGGVVGGAARFIEFQRGRSRTTGERRPADQSQLQFAQDVDAAQTAMEQGGNFPTGRDDRATATETGQSQISPEGTLGRILTPLDPAAPEAHPIIGQLLDFIGDLEAPEGYNQVFSGIPQSNLPPRPITEMTVDQVLAWQDAVVRAGANSSAAGRFQIIRGTLRHLKDRMGLRGDEVFSQQMQNRMAVELMREQGLEEFVAGRMSARRFGQNIAGVWAALPQLSGAGRGASVFQNFNGNKALTSARKFEQVLTRPGSFRTTGDLLGEANTFNPVRTSRGFTGQGQVTAGGDLRIDVEYQVVDASDLIRASGDLQPRDRSRAASDEQISEIAATLDPARLLPSPEADRGAPIVGPDNVIESGNGRVQALQRAFERHPDRADAYRQQIEAAGFEIPPGVSTPVLIGRRTSDLTPEQRQAFVRRANTSAVARMSATERAAMDARSIDGDTLATFDPTQPIGSRGNVPFTRRFLNSLPQAERSGLVDATGALNAEGVLRVRQALFARAFDAPDILARFAEADAGELRSLIDALEGSAPDWAAMRAAVAEGRVAPEFDITDFVLDAMRLIATAREVAGREGSTAAQVVEDMLNNLDLLEGATAPLTAALVRKFLVKGRAAPAAKITDFLRRYAAEAQKVGSTQASLLDDVPGPLDVLKTLDRETFGDLTETGRTRVPNNPRPLPVIETEVIPEGAFADGASSPEAIAAADLAAAQLRGEVQRVADLSPDMNELAELVGRGADPSEIEASPAVIEALAKMQELAERETIGIDGYGGDDWHALRQYVFDGEVIVGTDEALQRWASDAKSFAGNEGPAFDRLATIILGPPASGKSSIAEELALHRRAAILDSDEIKKTLPEYDGGIGAARVHEESSDLANELELALRSEGVNLIVPKVGNSPNSIRSVIERFKSDGYRVHVVNMAVAPDEAYRRMIGRFISTGRIIPPDYMRSIGDGPSATFIDLKREGLADGYAEIDNNGARNSAREVREIAGENPFEGTPFDLRRGGEQTVPPVARTGSGDQEGIQPERLTSPSSDLRAQFAALNENAADVVLDLEDGTSVSAREILDDLDADDALLTIIDACTVGGRA